MHTILFNWRIGTERQLNTAFSILTCSIEYCLINHAIGPILLKEGKCSHRAELFACQTQYDIFINVDYRFSLIIFCVLNNKIHVSISRFISQKSVLIKELFRVHLDCSF